MNMSVELVNAYAYASLSSGLRRIGFKAYGSYYSPCLLPDPFHYVVHGYQLTLDLVPIRLCHAYHKLDFDLRLV